MAKIGFENGSLVGVTIPGTSYAKNFLYGLNSNTDQAGTNYRTYIKINTGRCRDVDDSFDMVNEYLIDLYSLNSGANGLDTGTIAANNWYYLYLIAKSSDTSTGTNTSVTSLKLVDSAADFVTDGVVVGDAVYNIDTASWTKVTAIDSSTQLSIAANIFSPLTGYNYIVGPKSIAMLSLSGSSPTMPSGYSYKRLIAMVRTDASAYFRPYYIVGNSSSKTVKYETPVYNSVLSAGSATAYTDIDCSGFVPVNSSVAIISLGTLTANWLYTKRNNVSTNWENRKSGQSSISADSLFYQGLDSSQIFDYKVDNVSASGYIYVYGYILEL